MVKLYVGTYQPRTTRLLNLFIFEMGVRTVLRKENTDLPLLPFSSRHP